MATRTGKGTEHDQEYEEDHYGHDASDQYVSRHILGHHGRGGFSGSITGQRDGLPGRQLKPRRPGRRVGSRSGHWPLRVAGQENRQAAGSGAGP